MTPPASARSMIACPVASSACRPNVIVPRQIGVTLRPVRPRRTWRMRASGMMNVLLSNQFIIPHSSLVFLYPLPQRLHPHERMRPPAVVAGLAEAGLHEGALGADVPVERVEVDAAHLLLGEEVDEEGTDDVGAVALVPVALVADGNAQLRLAAALVDVVVHHVADMAAAEVLDGGH